MYTILGFGERLYARRKDMGMTRGELAEKMSKYGAGVHYETIKTWENGGSCKIDFIPVLCEILDCDTEYLFGNSTTQYKAIADVSEVTGLSEESVKLLIKGLKARINDESLPFDEHLLSAPEILDALDFLIQNFYGNQLLFLLFSFIRGNIDRVGMIAKTNESGSVDGFRGQITKDDFFFEVYDKSIHSTRYYNSEEFATLMKNSTYTELQETIFRLRDQLEKESERNGKH